MKIREHYFIGNWCLFCGGETFFRIQKYHTDRGQSVPQTDERVCVEREDHVGHVRPEPARRLFASEDFDTIGMRLKQLYTERTEAMNTDIDAIKVEDEGWIYG